MYVQTRLNALRSSTPTVLSFRRIIAFSGPPPPRPRPPPETQILVPRTWVHAPARPEPCVAAPPPLSVLLSSVESLLQRPQMVLTLVWPGVRIQIQRAGPRSVVLRLGKSTGLAQPLVDKLRVALAHAGIRLQGATV